MQIIDQHGSEKRERPNGNPDKTNEIRLGKLREFEMRMLKVKCENTGEDKVKNQHD